MSSIDSFDPKDHPSISKLKIIWHSVASHIKCYTPDTEVLTISGWKFISDITLDDLVLTIDPYTLLMKYDHPTNIYSYDYDGDLLRFKGHFMDITVTPEHMLLISDIVDNLKKDRAIKDIKWKLVEASDYLFKEFLILKSGIWDGSSTLIGVNIGSANLGLIDLVTLFGIYLSVGRLKEDCVEFYYKSESQLNKILNIVEKVTFETPIIEDHKVISKHRDLIDFLESYSDKHIPLEIKLLSGELLRKFIESYFDRDSHSLFTKSQRMKDDLQEVCIKAGYSSDCSFKNNQWCISIEKNHIALHIGIDDDVIKYNGKVYCIEVPTHVLLVRRKGKALFCGNSGYGVLTNNVVSRLHNLGYEIIVSAYYGIEPGGIITINDVPHVPTARHLGTFGEGSYINHYVRFKRNLGILASDWWAFPWFPDPSRNSLLYSPMDHINYPERIIELTRKYQVVCSFLPFAYKELKRRGIDSYIVPHGVSSVFSPLDKKESRKITGFPSDVFLVGIVAANSDKETRKSWSEIFMAAQYIRENYPDIRDIRYFVHSDPLEPKGVYLQELAQNRGVLDLFAFEDPHLAVIGLPDEELNLLYNSFDILLNPCHSDDTLAWTKTGMKHYFDLNVGDEIWTLNANGELELNPIEEIMIHPYKGELICFKNKQLSLKVTPNHRIYYSTPSMRDSLQVKEANDLISKRSRLYLPTKGKWIGKDSEYVDISRFNDKTISDNVRTSTLLSIIGWYISNGYVYPVEDHIVFANIGINNVSKLSNLLMELGLTVNVDGDYLTVQSRTLLNILMECGTVNKVIPDWILDYSPTYLRCLFNAMLKGSRKYCTISDLMKDRFIELCMKLGYSVRVYGKSNEWIISIREVYNSGTLEIPNHVSKINYTGIVWCVKTKNSNFFTFKDGLLCMSGNSKREGFGLPIIESMACGRPVIGHRFSSMPDLLGFNEERGWLCDTVCYTDTPISATTAVPDYRSIAECIVDAYNHPNKVEEKGKRAREFSLKFLWDDIVMNNWVYVLDKFTEEYLDKEPTIYTMRL